MDRIVLEVDGRMANAWRNSSPAFKSRMEKEINLRIGKRLKEAQRAEFKQAIVEARDEAEAKELTEEILEQLLSEDEE